MFGDSTFDTLKSKPKGTLFKEYCTLPPGLRYTFNVKAYLDGVVAELERGDISTDEVLIHLDRVSNSVAGVYDLINRHVSLLQLRAQFGDNPTVREKAKLEHIEDVLDEEDFLPVSLDDRMRSITRDFDESYDTAKKSALAKKAAGLGAGRSADAEDDKAKESRRATRRSGSSPSA